MIKEDLLKLKRKQNRAQRVRQKIRAKAPGMLRLSVFESNKHFYAQIIDDAKGVTLIAASEKDVTGNGTMTKTQKAGEVGKAMAQKAKGKKISEVVFDKGPYIYHGRVKAFAEAAREGGLKF